MNNLPSLFYSSLYSGQMEGGSRYTISQPLLHRFSETVDCTVLVDTAYVNTVSLLCFVNRRDFILLLLWFQTTYPNVIYMPEPSGLDWKKTIHTHFGPETIANISPSLRTQKRTSCFIQ